MSIESETHAYYEYAYWLTSSQTRWLLTPGRRFIIFSSAARRTPSCVNSMLRFPLSASTLTFLRYRKKISPVSQRAAPVPSQDNCVFSERPTLLESLWKSSTPYAYTLMAVVISFTRLALDVSKWTPENDNEIITPDAQEHHFKQNAYSLFLQVLSSNPKFKNKSFCKKHLLRTYLSLPKIF